MQEAVQCLTSSNIAHSKSAKNSADVGNSGFLTLSTQNSGSNGILKQEVDLICYVEERRWWKFTIQKHDPLLHCPNCHSKKLFFSPKSSAKEPQDYIVNEHFKKCPPHEWKMSPHSSHWMEHPGSPLRISVYGGVEGIHQGMGDGGFTIVDEFDRLRREHQKKKSNQSAREMLDKLKNGQK